VSNVSQPIFAVYAPGVQHFAHQRPVAAPVNRHFVTKLVEDQADVVSHLVHSYIPTYRCNCHQVGGRAGQDHHHGDRVVYTGVGVHNQFTHRWQALIL
jgi:hypothetical protein